MPTMRMSVACFENSDDADAVTGLITRHSASSAACSTFFAQIASDLLQQATSKRLPSVCCESSCRIGLSCCMMTLHVQKRQAIGVSACRCIPAQVNRSFSRPWMASMGQSLPMVALAVAKPTQ